MRAKYVIFDLDDTLIQEIDFLKSAYQEIALFLEPSQYLSLFANMLQSYQAGKNVFKELVAQYPHTTIEELLTLYRQHKPKLKLNEGAIEVLDWCKEKGYQLGLLTDGRSITQRNKINAVGIAHYFNTIIISEEFGSSKPDPRNFQVFVDYKITEYVYIADNPKKDFITPNDMGWTTICLLDSGRNIHRQNFSLQPRFLPNYTISNLMELKNLIE